MIFFPSLSLLLATGAFATRIITDPRAVSETCETISAAVSFASAVHYSGPSYEENIRHWASSSTQRATCFIRAGLFQLQILGKDRVPFAVKGGGHTLNPGFSSTTGIQIAMSRFSEIVYDPESRTVAVGAGVIWDDVYAALEPHGVNVVGGRASGIGVAGFTLGGGYSWLTNQYGLALDNVESFELVLPNGTVIDVTESFHPDLFFGLRGGYNNFIEPRLQGGVMIYPETSVDQVTHATANFSASNDDPKAQMIMTTNYAAGNHFVVTILFYDSPDPAPGVFDAFLGIPVLIKDVKTRSFLSLVLAASSFPEADPSPSESLVEPFPQGGAFNTVTVTKYSVELIEAAINESIHWGQTLMAFSGVFTSYDFTPVMPTTLKRSSTSSAWPPTYKDAIIPIVLYIAWISESSDDVMHDMVQRSMSTLLEKAVSLGLDIMDAPLYSNCALFDTPIERMYGNNIERLRKIKNDVDPYSVMSLTGGFKF
ncbi:FAD-binding domain-containing protein [Pisolithus marmoratus]|nr:FAD-binding domain-containing protein [Pisolithus marmoratus]